MIKQYYIFKDILIKIINGNSQNIKIKFFNFKNERILLLVY